jgi:hypothetical protein
MPDKNGNGDRNPYKVAIMIMVPIMTCLAGILGTSAYYHNALIANIGDMDKRVAIHETRTELDEKRLESLEIDRTILMNYMALEVSKSKSKDSLR